ncbi:S9 family peptidase [Zavarzinella formosa]|uniref:S9 family peptidase n=1 Tax=Zavarzinella formosa TaxID=360055 RepID=UPI00138ADFCB|nr:prolyl oligopeptidase family serine peptidase [Zavarzinella formosa]
MRWAFLLGLLAAGSMIAGEKDRQWTVDDVLLNESARDVEISPDGRFAVWVKSVMDEDKGESIANIIRTDLTTQTDVPLTRGKDKCSSPRFSPDGKFIAFLSDRVSPLSKAKGRSATKTRSRKKGDDDGKTQVWILDLSGGEAWAVTEFARDVQSFGWAGSDHLVFMAQEEKGRYEEQTKEKKDTSNLVEDDAHEPPVRLFRTDLAGKTTERLTLNKDRIEWFAVSPDGKRAVTHHQQNLRHAYDGRSMPTTELYDLETGKHDRIFTGKFDLAGVRWKPDSEGFYAINHFGNAIAGEGPFVGEVHEFTVKTKEAKKVDLGWERGLAQQDINGSAEGLIVFRDGFFALLTNGVTNKLARFTFAEGKWKRDLLTGEQVKNIFGLQASRDGQTLVYAHSTSSQPTRWHTAKIKESAVTEAKPIMKLEDSLEGKTFAKTEVVRWKGALDEEIEGMLYYPHGYAPGKKHPLVVMIHGGPHYADSDDWQDDWAYPANLYCQRGAFVFKPNYHGSSNYGLKFAESIADGKYYDLEVPDIEKGVDHLIAKGLVDPEKLGVMGWSNGSILSIALTTHSTRYKAASTGAGDVDWVSDWGNCDFGEAFDRYYIGKNPLTDPKRYQDKSPFYKLDKVRTPTIIFFGAEDRTVPAQQGWMHYRGLQQAGKTDVRFILFPGEVHSPKKLVHQRRKVTEELAWFEKHLFKTFVEKSEVLREDSPLARLVENGKAAKDSGRFGLIVKDKLIPEVIPHQGLLVGRFEVTAAQYAVFDPKWAIEKGRDNYPAFGIKLEQAKAYCEWLSKHTGEKYRLPTEEEGGELYTETDGENTLDHWAGYTVNPDDAKRLTETMKNLPGAAPLLREVGQFGKAGDKATPRDLGGNIAEWVTTKDGSKLMGGSADQPADAKQKDREPGEQYRGFRVVREEKAKK